MTKWQTIAEIADRFESIPVARVERFMRHIGLHDTGNHRRWREADDAYEYSPGAVGLIEREARSRNYALKPAPIAKIR